MHITHTSANAPFSPSHGNMPLPDIHDQMRQQRRRHRFILMQRTLGFWWYRILLVVLGGCIAASFGQSALAFPKEIFGGIIVAPILFFAARRPEYGVLLIAISATAFFPSAFTVKSLTIYLPVPLLLLLFFVAMLQIAFHIKKPVLPSFRVIWPLLALILMALISNLLALVDWLPGVPHKVNNSPAFYDEILAVVMFCMPLICLVVTTVALTNKDQWIEYILRAFLILASLAALIVIIDFKRVGADAYSFRFLEPNIFWMSLHAIAQLLGLGTIIAYAHVLYSARWRMRIMYGGALLLCLVGIYLTLQNSWWIEIAVALVVITFVYSRRLLFSYLLALIPLFPLLLGLFNKLQAVKAADFTRFIIWQDALRVWSKQPLIGVGPGNYWTYAQYLTHLPLDLRNFTRVGFGVAHNGYLQLLGELGLVGLFFWLALIVVLIVTAIRLYRCSNTPEARADRKLALIGLGLICGSAVADFTDGSFIVPPRQVGGFNDIPLMLTSWIIFGCIAYKDQLWRLAHNGLKLKD
jgi:O-antigen ligase